LAAISCTERPDDRGFHGTPAASLGFRWTPGFATRLALGRYGRGNRLTGLKTGQFGVDFGDLGQQRFFLFHQRDDPFEVRGCDLRKVHVGEG
jgi:hypothetical protein